MDHPIFRTPYAVEPTITREPTPPSYAHYPEGEGLGETMPMWRVQTEGYQDGNDQLIGMVSRDAGFLDSPDTEWISSGANSKGPRAVAIGRHGNFLHWGFAASPTYLTDEAKLVLVNALHYIAEFDGRTPIARKTPGTMLRSAVDSMLADVTDAGYAKVEARYEEIRRDMDERKAEVQARIDAGEEVSELERQMLSARAVETPGRFDRLRRSLPGVMKDVGDESPEEVVAIVRSVVPYLRPGEWYSLAVDEDARALGVATSDPAFLDRALASLESGEDDGLGARLLKRYTGRDVASADDWREWLEGNRERLFFTEAGGYLWLVDTTSADEVARAPALEPTNARPLDWSARVVSGEGGGAAVVVDVSVLDGWHAYDRVPDAAPYVPLRLELALPDGVRAAGEWIAPPATADGHDPGMTLWVGEVTFRRELEGWTAGDEVTVTLHHQVCDERMCMPPTREEKSAR